MSFADAGKKIVEAAAAGAYKGATIVMADSQVLVPVEFGTLKRSGVVEEPVIEGDTITVTLGYGYGVEYTGRVLAEDAADPDGEANSPGYAIYVHEIARYKHAPPTTYKFLEKAARAFEPQFGPTIQAEIERRLGT